MMILPRWQRKRWTNKKAERESEEVLFLFSAKSWESKSHWREFLKASIFCTWEYVDGLCGERPVVCVVCGLVKTCSRPLDEKTSSRHSTLTPESACLQQGRERQRKRRTESIEAIFSRQHHFLQLRFNCFLEQAVMNQAYKAGQSQLNNELFHPDENDTHSSSSIEQNNNTTTDEPDVKK